MRDYFLHVDMLVEKDNVELFEQAVVKYFRQGGLKRFGWILGAALRSRTAVLRGDTVPMYKASDPDTAIVDLQKKPVECFRYVHLWNIPEGTTGLVLDARAPGKTDIAGIMQELADDDAYNDVNALIRREIQNLVLRVEHGENPVLVVRSGRAAQLYASDASFMRVTRQMETKHLGGFVFQAGIIAEILKAAGWSNMGSFQNVTGYLNTIVEFWKTPTLPEERAIGNQGMVVDKLRGEFTRHLKSRGSSGEAKDKAMAIFESTLIKPFTKDLVWESRERFVPASYWHLGNG